MRQAHEKLGETWAEAGPISETAIHQVKPALAIGAASEGAVAALIWIEDVI